MVDIHTHIIPYVDDGSKSLNDSIEMIKHEIEIGVDTIIATPHHIFHRFTKSVEEIKENFDLLVKEVKRLNLNVTLLLGQEIYLSTKENTIEMLKEGKLLTINNTNRILVEFSYTREPEDLIETLYNFIISGYEVIIAHIERYEWMTFDKAVSLKKEGALIQVNSDSVIGKVSFKEKRLIKRLLKNDLVDFIASDTHSFRPSTLDKAYKKVKNEKLFNYSVE